MLADITYYPEVNTRGKTAINLGIEFTGMVGSTQIVLRGVAIETWAVSPLGSGRPTISMNSWGPHDTTPAGYALTENYWSSR